MFLDYKKEKGPIFKARVNTLIGSLFLGTCALWAAMFIWNITTGENPISHVIASAIGNEL